MCRTPSTNPSHSRKHRNKSHRRQTTPFMGVQPRYPIRALNQSQLRSRQNVKCFQPRITCRRRGGEEEEEERHTRKFQGTRNNFFLSSKELPKRATNYYYYCYPLPRFPPFYLERIKSRQVCLDPHRVGKSKSHRHLCVIVKPKRRSLESRNQ